MFSLFFVNQALGNHRWYIILRWYFIQESLLLQNELTQYITNKTAASAAEDNISITSVTYSVQIIFYLSRCMIGPRILETSPEELMTRHEFTIIEHGHCSACLVLNKNRKLNQNRQLYIELWSLKQSQYTNPLKKMTMELEF